MIKLSTFSLFDSNLSMRERKPAHLNKIHFITYTLASHTGDMSTATSVLWPGNLGNTVMILSSTDSIEWLVTPQRSSVRSTIISDAGIEQF